MLMSRVITKSSGSAAKTDVSASGGAAAKEENSLSVGSGSSFATI